MKGAAVETDDIEDMIGAAVLDRDDDRIGEIRQVYLDSDTEQPTWVGVRIGLLGTEVLVPLADADWDTHALRTAVSRSTARSAPAIDLDEPLTHQEEERLFFHYGIPSVRTPREPVRLDGFDGDDVCYSVHEDPATSSSAPGGEVGRATDDAWRARREEVSGHMLRSRPAREQRVAS